jgi:hypothetical protein
MQTIAIGTLKRRVERLAAQLRMRSRVMYGWASWALEPPAQCPGFSDPAKVLAT